MRPGGDGERGGGVALVRRARGCEGAHHRAVDQHLEVLLRRLVVAALGGVEGEHVGAGGPAADALAERAGLLEEGDLEPLGGRWVARGEAAVVAGDAGAAGEGPGRAGRVVLELARTHRHLLESRVGDRAVLARCDGDLIDEGGVVAAGTVQSLERDRVRPGGDGERGGGVSSGTTCPRV